MANLEGSGTNISEDATSPDTAYRNKIIHFVDETNNDFHLANTDTNARNQGTDLSADANLALADDIDGDTRPYRNVWDIGADENRERRTVLNTPITDRFTSGLVGHWTFNGEDMDWGSSTAEVLDRSGQDNYGDVTNFGQEGAVIGKVGQALEFDGSNDYVNIGTGPTSVKTVAFWVYPETTTEYFVNITGVTERIWANAGTITATGFSSPTIYVDGAVSSTMVADQWHFIVITTATAENASSFKIGRIDLPASEDYLEGKMDEVRLYNYALSTSTIQDLYRTEGRKFGVNTPTTDYLTAGLVGHWTFNGQDMDWSSSTAEALDRSGNNNNGDVTNFGKEGAVIGKVGQALEFDGSNDYVNAGDIAAIDGVSQLTAMGWMYIKSFADWEMLMEKRTDGNNEFYMAQSASGYGGNNDVMIDLSNGSDTYGYTNDDILSLGVWGHWVMVFDGSQAENGSRLKFYFNGVQQTLNFGGTIPSTTANAGNLYIGHPTNSPDGLIDEVRIYNYALSTSTIQQLYRLGARKFEIG